MLKVSAVSVLLGVAVIGTAAVVYEWYKSGDKDKKRRPLVSLGQSKKADDKSRIEMKISNDKVPLMNGRAGHNLESIQEKTGTIITLREKDENNHVCEITGTYKNVLEAERLIRESVKRSVTVTEEMSIPPEAFARIAARGGQVLKDICLKSMAQVYRDPGSEPLVKITGTEPNVKVARQLIDEQVKASTLELAQEVKREPRGSPRPTDDGGVDQTDDGARHAMRPDALQGQLEVYVSASASVGKFWVQLCGPQTAKLDELVDSMTTYYAQEETREAHRIADPYLGQIVTTQFKYDQKWYRAEVVGILPSEYDPRNVVLDVFFVDYGDSQYVDPKDVYSISTNFLTLRFQAIECFLAEVKPARPSLDDEWDAEAKARFEELTYVARWKKLIAQVVTTKEKSSANSSIGSSITGITLYERAGKKQVNIAQQLVSEGLAISTNTTTVNPSVSRSSSERESGSGNERKTASSTATKSAKKSSKTTKNGSVKNNGVPKTGDVSSPPTTKTAPVINNGGVPSIHDARFSDFKNKSWNEMLEDDE